MKKWFVLIGLFSALTSCALAQSDAEKDAYCVKVFDKIHQVDLSFNILPLLLTKQQINQLLTALEKSKANVRRVMDAEYQHYKEYEELTDKTIQLATEQGVLPSQDSREKLGKLLLADRAMRDVMVMQNVDYVKKVIDKSFTPTQMKVALNTLQPTLFNPALKPEEMTNEEKEELYIREILLHPLTYDLLLKMAKFAK